VLPVREEIVADNFPSEASEDALVGVTYQDTAASSLVVADEDVAASIPLPPVSDAPTDINESVEYNTGDVNHDMKDETEDLNLACGNMTDEDHQYPLTVDEKDAKESDSIIVSEMVPELESISNSAGELQEEELKKAKPEQMEAGTHSAPDVTEAQAEESEQPVAGQVVMLQVDNVFSGILDGMCSSQISLVHQQVPVEVVSQENVCSDVPVQSVVSDRLKENMTSDDLHNKTMGELKRMLKSLRLGGEKSDCNKTTNKVRLIPLSRVTYV